jgi:hypothetical protein
MEDTNNEELEQLASEQLNDLENDDEQDAQKAKTRRERVLEFYNQGAIRTEEDHYHAALIMLYGNDVAHFELSKTFARRAAELGEARAWSLIAAATDRSLLARSLPQKYGTQFVREGGRWTLGKIDPAVTDAQRALYGVPPLWVQQQQVEKLRSREEPD